jgi:pimeloyl-ACP methyl ester carboxylesterase
MRAGVEAFIRFVAGDANYEALPPDRRERVLGNGETAFLIEPAMYENFHPDPKALEATKCPLKVLAGIEGAPFFAEMANRLAKSLRTEVVRMPGAHTPQTDHPAEVVQAIQAFFS